MLPDPLRLFQIRRRQCKLHTLFYVIFFFNKNFELTKNLLNFSIKSTSTPKPNGSVRTGLSGVVLPPPISDPFSSTAFGIGAPSPPQPSNSSATPSAIVASSNTSTAAPVASGSNVMESFANFDNVKFESVSGKNYCSLTTFCKWDGRNFFFFFLKKLCMNLEIP